MTAPTAATVLVEGWLDIHHSYAQVNRNLVKHWLACPDLKLFFRAVPYFRPDWTPSPFLADDPVVQTAAQQRYRGERIDALFRCSFPYDVTHPPTGAVAFLFMTAESAQLNDSYFVGGGLATFVELVRKGRIVPVVPSLWCADVLRRLGVQPLVVPHGVDPGVFRPRMVDRDRIMEILPQLLPTDFVFFSAGAMTDNKGIDLLLTAFKKLRESHPHSKLLLKGFGALYGDRFNDLPAESGVVYLGDEVRDADMAFLYNCCDCYVTPYRAEGFNLPALEAAACGVPVIATAGGPTDEFLPVSHRSWIPVKSQIVETPENGRMLLPDEDSLLEAMKRVASHPRWARSAVLDGSPHVHRLYTWQIQADKLRVAFARST